MKSEELIRIEDQYGAHNYHPLDVVITRGQGVWVYDVDVISWLVADVLEKGVVLHHFSRQYFFCWNVGSHFFAIVVHIHHFLHF